MPKSVFSGSHSALVETLLAVRTAAGITQAELARRLGKDQSFVSNVERSERRLDVLEFYAYACALGADPVELFAQVAAKLPKQLNI